MSAEDPDRYVTLSTARIGMRCGSAPRASLPALSRCAQPTRPGRSWKQSHVKCTTPPTTAGPSVSPGARNPPAMPVSPPGRPGRPILAAICSAGLTDILVVVTRYFGGIKLGTGGLARAYREAAGLVLQTAPRSIRHRTALVEVSFGFPQTGLVEPLLSRFEALRWRATTVKRSVFAALRQAKPEPGPGHPPRRGVERSRSRQTDRRVNATLSPG